MSKTIMKHRGIYEIPLADGLFAYGRVYKRGPDLGVVNQVRREKLYNVADIIPLKYAFHTHFLSFYLRSVPWRYLGLDPNTDEYGPPCVMFSGKALTPTTRVQLDTNGSVTVIAPNEAVGIRKKILLTHLSIQDLIFDHIKKGEIEVK